MIAHQLSIEITTHKCILSHEIDDWHTHTRLNAPGSFNFYIVGNIYPPPSNQFLFQSHTIGFFLYYTHPAKKKTSKHLSWRFLASRCFSDCSIGNSIVLSDYTFARRATSIIEHNRSNTRNINLVIDRNEAKNRSLHQFHNFRALVVLLWLPLPRSSAGWQQNRRDWNKHTTTAILNESTDWKTTGRRGEGVQHSREQLLKPSMAAPYK